MRVQMILMMTGMLSALLSAPALAHLSEPGAVLPHIFTGEHLLILIAVGVCVVVASTIRKRSR